VLDQLDATNGNLLLINIEIILINNKSPFVASSWSNTYLLIKDARSLKHKVSV